MPEVSTPGPVNGTVVRNNDLWVLILGYVRYAMGRTSAAPSWAHSMIRDYAKALSDQQLQQIADEITSELVKYERLGKTLGHDCDHQEWKNCVDSILVQQTHRERSRQPSP